tara:strand:+ start:2372 stop:2515 length:144 start_codon:yes stop_codon:yes gene_type:complete
VTNGLKPDGQTTLVGEEGNINKTSSPPHDLNPLMDTRESPLRPYQIK